MWPLSFKAAEAGIQLRHRQKLEMTTVSDGDRKNKKTFTHWGFHKSQSLFSEPKENALYEKLATGTQMNNADFLQNTHAHPHTPVLVNTKGKPRAP